MTKKNLPLIVIIASFALIILNFVFTSDEMNSGFWLRIISSLLLIIGMYLTIKERKKTLPVWNMRQKHTGQAEENYI